DARARRPPPSARPRPHGRRALEARWRAGDSGRPARRQRAVDTGHGPQGGDQFRPGRCAEAVGRHGHHPCRRQDRRAPPRPPRERDLRGARPRAHALGRAAGVHGRGRAGRLHLRAAVRAAPGDQRQSHRSARVRAVPQRRAGRGGQPGHRAGGKARAGAVGRSDPSDRRGL
ncbi:MAG: hypothetical protein AVDCRST_MAG51-1096, partial [uncultured Ramlibacter sp.]